MIALIVIVTIWLIGAAMTLKAEAMLSNQPTHWGVWPLALVAWLPVAIIICSTKHSVYTERDYETKEYHY